MPPLRKIHIATDDQVTDITAPLPAACRRHRQHKDVLPGRIKGGAEVFVGTVFGMGLPPAPVYILIAIVLPPPFMQAGVNQWVVHFFAVFVAVFRELTPPTSITRQLHR
jgi:hypothetical protein